MALIDPVSYARLILSNRWSRKDVMACARMQRRGSPRRRMMMQAISIARRAQRPI